MLWDNSSMGNKVEGMEPVIRTRFLCIFSVVVAAAIHLQYHLRYVPQTSVLCSIEKTAPV